MADAYARFAVEFEADLSGVQAGMQQGLSWSRAYGQGAAAEYASGLAQGLGNLSGGMGMLQSLRGQFASTAQGLSEIFGMKAGAEMSYFRRQLTGMTGDAKLAQQTLDGLIKIANTTSYSNADIFQMATNAMGSGTSAQNVVPEVSNILDAAAGIGIRDMSVFSRFQRNLFDLRGKEGEANQRDVNELYKQAPQFVFQAARAMGTNVQGARDQINSMTGQDLYSLIVKIGEANTGKAAREGMGDPFTVAANAAEQLRSAMAPTGEAVNRFITPMIRFAATSAEIFGEFNKLGVGIPGLVLAVGVTVGAYRIYQATIGRTTLALNALASAATRAAVVQGGSSIGVGGVSGASGGRMSRAGRIGLGVGLGAAAGASMAGTAIADANPNNQNAQTAGNYLSNAGTGAMIGMGIGGFAGPPGMAIGAGIGALGGIGVSAYQQYQGNKAKEESSKIERAADKLEKAAGSLQEAAADGYGGGKRMRSTLSSIEAGWALVGAERLGIA